jgi:hypothetical protein
MSDATIAPAEQHIVRRATRDIVSEKARLVREKAKYITPRIHRELHRDATDFVRFYVVELVVLIVLRVEPASVVHHAAVWVWRIVP